MYIVSNQDKGIESVSAGPFLIRTVFDKSKDASKNGEPAEDYIKIKYKSTQVVFALCDGVSKSFLGHIGSKYLGDYLVEWLDSIHDSSDNEEMDLKDGLISELTDYLNKKKKEVTEELKKEELDSSNELVFKVLTKRREEAGTQSNFVCGRLDAPTENYPLGRLFLFWLGDAELRVWVDDETDINQALGQERRKEAWTSLDGVVGTIEGYIGNLESINCVMAYSDGLNQYRDDLLPSISQGKLWQYVLDIQKSPFSDDISFVQIDFDKRYTPPVQETRDFHHIPEEIEYYQPIENRDVESDTKGGNISDAQKTEKPKKKKLLVTFLVTTVLLLIPLAYLWFSKLPLSEVGNNTTSQTVTPKDYELVATSTAQNETSIIDEDQHTDEQTLPDNPLVSNQINSENFLQLHPVANTIVPDFKYFSVYQDKLLGILSEENILGVYSLPDLSLLRSVWFPSDIKQFSFYKNDVFAVSDLGELYYWETSKEAYAILSPLANKIYSVTVLEDIDKVLMQSENGPLCLINTNMLFSNDVICEDISFPNSTDLYTFYAIGSDKLIVVGEETSPAMLDLVTRESITLVDTQIEMIDVNDTGNFAFRTGDNIISSGWMDFDQSIIFKVTNVWNENSMIISTDDSNNYVAGPFILDDGSILMSRGNIFHLWMPDELMKIQMTFDYLDEIKNAFITDDNVYLIVFENNEITIMQTKPQVQ